MSRAPIGVLALLLAALGLAGCTTGAATSPAAPGTRTATTSPPATAPASAGPATSSSPRPGPPATPDRGSGIAGVTTIDRCPLVRAESPCPAQPVSARMSIVDGKGVVVAAVTSDRDGHFTIAVNPGRYLIRVLSINGGPPHPQPPAQVTVTVGRYTTVALRFDSGIR